MPIEKITAEEFRAQIRAGITARSETFDVGYGPVRDIVIDPMGAVLEDQNDRIRRVSLLVSLLNSDEFTDDDLDQLVFNEGLTRIEGSKATTTLTFSVAVISPSDPNRVVQRGFPVATVPDTSTGSIVTFVTTEERELLTANASQYFNLTTQRYELDVPAVAVVAGEDGLVSAGRLTRSLRPLVGFDRVTNRAASAGGRARETNAELIQRYLLSILGRDLSTPAGIERWARDGFPDVEDVRVVYGSDPLLTRGDTDAGAVDAYIVGEQLINATESVEFLGVNQVITLAQPPIRTVLSVIRTSDSTVYTEGTDFEVVNDSTAYGGSTLGADGIRFIVGGTLPSPGDALTVTYSYNALIRDLQVSSSQDDSYVFGRDLLWKEGIRVGIILEATLRAVSGFNAATVASLASDAIVDYINTLELGADVEVSDLQQAVRRISGVDNFVITRLVRDPAASGTSDVVIGANEYPRITDTDVSIVPV